MDIRTMPRRIGVPRGVCGLLPGGFLVGFADGDVWCLSNKIPFETLEQFLTVGETRAQRSRDRDLGPYRIAL
jgi:hypothetical protein